MKMLNGRLVLAAFTLFAVVGCADSHAADRADRVAAEKASVQNTVEDLSRITLEVPNMACRLCARTITHQLGEMGVEQVQIDLRRKLVTGEFNPERLTSEAIRERIESSGYHVADVQVD